MISRLSSFETWDRRMRRSPVPQFRTRCLAVHVAIYPIEGPRKFACWESGGWIGDNHDQILVPPPPGVESNFINPPSQKVFLVSSTVIFNSLMLLAVAIRFYVKGWIKRNLGWDDWTCAFSAITSIISSILLLNAMKVGIGKHLWDIRLVTFLNAANYLQTEIIFPLYTLAIYSIKLSIILLYLKVFSMGRKQRYFAYLGLVVLGLFYGVYFVILIVQMAAIGVVTDIYILILPIPKILKLQISAERKATLLLVFGTGIVTCGISITRLGLVSKYAAKVSGDLLWNVAVTSELAMIELNVGIVAACAPSISAFLTHLKVFNYGLRANPKASDTSRYASDPASQFSNTKSLESGGLADEESACSPRTQEIVNEDRYSVQKYQRSLESGERSPGWESHKSWLVLDEKLEEKEVLPPDMMPTYK
ncbi:hypothetical protein B7494_g724 [Chlorociboria aeruginascens]|nr:hypothetical protein B7494_g724 [Chlorociboria aeruginascens]